MKNRVRVWEPTALGATKSSFTRALRCREEGAGKLAARQVAPRGQLLRSARPHSR